MKTHKISKIVDKHYYIRYGYVNNTLKVSHRKEMIPYVWLQLDDDNLVKGKYCSSSLYDNRLFDKVNIGDKIIIDNIEE